MSDYQIRAVKVPNEKAELVRAELCRRLGLDPGQIVAGSLTMNWDASGASVKWSGYVPLEADEAAAIFEAALGAGA